MVVCRLCDRLDPSSYQRYRLRAMSFIDNAMEVLDRTEASLHAVIADALAAKAYKEIATIAAMAEAVAAISAARRSE